MHSFEHYMPPSASTAVHPRPRLRLSADVRAAKLLDSALLEFSNCGYAAATVEAVANRAGLSKSGFYAHFSSKEAVFETLLENLLMPRIPNVWAGLEQGVPLRDVIDAYIDSSYEQLLAPTSIALLKVMIADSHRLVHLSQRWERSVLDPYLRVQQDLIDRCVARGLMRRSPMTDRFSMVISPVIFLSIRAMAMLDADADEVAHQRESHRELLYMLLEPSPANCTCGFCPSN